MNAPCTDLTDRLNLAIAIARLAGETTLQYFQQENYQVDLKEDQSPVTVADREAEQLIRQHITSNFPDDGIIGEEFGAQQGNTQYCWVVDPIDGTKSFISGVPLYGTLVGVLHEQQAVIGVIYMPGLDEMIYAARGQGAWYSQGTSQPRSAQVACKQDLSEATLVTTQIDSFAQRDGTTVFQALEKEARITRTWGDCYGYLLVATGRADIMIDPIMNIWDAAAIQPILEEAGGTFTDWQGTASIHEGEGIGTNKQLLESVLSITANSPRPS